MSSLLLFRMWNVFTSKISLALFIRHLLSKVITLTDTKLLWEKKCYFYDSRIACYIWIRKEVAFCCHVVNCISPVTASVTVEWEGKGREGQRGKMRFNVCLEERRNSLRIFHCHPLWQNLFEKLLFTLCVSVFAYMYVCTQHACLMPPKARRKCRVPCDWSQWQMWASMWGLGNESSASRVTTALCHWTTSGKPTNSL